MQLENSWMSAWRRLILSLELHKGYSRNWECQYYKDNGDRGRREMIITHVSLRDEPVVWQLSSELTLRLFLHKRSPYLVSLCFTRLVEVPWSTFPAPAQPYLISPASPGLGLTHHNGLHILLPACGSNFILWMKRQS